MVVHELEVVRGLEHAALAAERYLPFVSANGERKILPDPDHFPKVVEC